MAHLSMQAQSDDRWSKANLEFEMNKAVNIRISELPVIIFSAIGHRITMIGLTKRHWIEIYAVDENDRIFEIVSEELA